LISKAKAEKKRTRTKAIERNRVREGERTFIVDALGGEERQ